MEFNTTDLASFVSDVALQVVTQASKDIVRYGNEVLTDAPFLRQHQEQEAIERLKVTMLPDATSYFTEAYKPDGDRSLQRIGTENSCLKFFLHQSNECCGTLA